MKRSDAGTCAVTSAGLVVAAFGRRYLVDTGGAQISCVTRARRGDLACGDRVRIQTTAPGEGVVETVEPRASLFFRSNAHRQKLIAANVSQVVIVLAAAPAHAAELLDRCLAAAEHARARVLIVLNKIDLEEQAREALARLATYRALGYLVVPLSAKNDVAPLMAHLEGHASVLVGPSGAGKSTIVNRLVPAAAARTAASEHALDRGRHTTTHARLYALSETSAIIDSPGMQTFGVHQIAATELPEAFVEFRAYAGRCRFSNCRHVAEPDCALAAAVHAGAIAPQRLRAYRALRAELEQR